MNRTGMGVVRRGSWMLLALAALFCSQALLTGQGQPRRARAAMKDGTDCYKSGKYAEAANHYAQAQAAQNELSATEKLDLATLIRQNNVALQARMEGSAQIRQAEELLRQGMAIEANNLLKSLVSNQYLSPADRQKMAQLNEQLRTSKMPPAPAGTNLDKTPKDYKSLLQAARRALTEGDLDMAENLATQAEKVAPFMRPWFFADSPAKVLREVQTQRAKMKAAPPSGQALPEKKETSNPLSSFKNLFHRTPKDAPKPPDKGVPSTSGSSPPPGPMLLPQGPPAPAKGDKKDMSKEKEAPSFLQTVKHTLTWPLGGGKDTPKDGTAKDGTPKEAPKIEEQTPVLDGSSEGPVLPGLPTLPPLPQTTSVPLPPPVTTPEFRPATKPQPQPKPVSAVPPTPVGMDPGAASASARQLIRQAYKALQENDLVTANRLALQAKSLRPVLEWWEDNPDRLLSEIQRQQSKAAKTGPMAPQAQKDPPPAEKLDARTLLRQARSAFQRNQLETASKLCAQAASVNTRWGLFEDSPEKLRADLQKVQARRDKDEAGRLLAEARQLIKKADFEGARKLAWQAQQLHGPYSVWDLGDRPTRVLADVDRAEGKPSKGAVLPPANVKKNEDSDVAKADPKGPPGLDHPPAPQGSAATQATARTRALTLLAEARDFQKKGMIVEALQKAQEARNQGAVFAPTEDSPENVLLSLASQCDRRIQVLCQQAQDAVLHNASDPARFQKAGNDLAVARSLAQAFGQDTYRIDQQWAWVEQVRTTGNTGPLAQGPPQNQAQASNVDPAKQQLGLEKLAKARLELEAGNRTVARRLAEEAFNPSYGIQKFAADMLRTIDAEDHYHAMNQANRAADASIEAFQRRDYRKTLGLITAIDLKLLTPDRQQRLREIMAMPEMQPGLVQASAQAPAKNAGLPAELPTPKAGDAVGMAQAGDLPKPATPAPPGGPLGLTDRFRALEEVQLQKLRDQALAVQNQAINLYKNGETARALDVLKDYLDELGRSQLDPERVAVLRRQIDTRIHQFRTLQAQRDLANEQKVLAGGHNEAERVKGIQKNQEEVARLIKQYNTFYSEGKYKEALAFANKAKDLDPDNVAATAAVMMSSMKIREKAAYELRNRKEQQVLDSLNDADDTGPSLTSKNPLHLDKEANERAKKRGDLRNGLWPTKTADQKAIELRLSQPISLHFKDTPLGQVFADLRALSGLNIVPDKIALQDANVSLEQPLTLTLDNIMLKSALNILLDQVKLTYTIKDQVLYITTDDRANSKQVTVTYSVADLVVPVENHPTPSVNNLQDALARHIASQMGVINRAPTPFTGMNSLPNGLPVSSYESGIGSSSMNPQGQGMTGAQTAVAKRYSQTIEELLIHLIENTVAPKTWRPMGQGTIQYFPLGMALVINQTQDVQEQIADLLAALRRLQDLEVAIEMRLVSVSESFFERMGVDFDINLKTNNSRFAPQLLSGNFAPFGFPNSFQPGSFVSGLTPAGTYTPDLNIPVRFSSFDFNVPPFGGYPGTLGADGGLFLGLAFLSDIQVFMMLEAAQGDRRANIMQAPKITVFNGQTANITVQDQQFFLTGITIQQAGSQIFFQPQNQPFPIGVQLQVTPVVSADRRFVRLNLQPTMTNLVSTLVPLIPIQIPVPQLFDGPGAGTTTTGQPVIFQMFFQQPTFTTISVSTTVNVPDGGTVLLGGMKTLSEARNEFGPPILSKIPYINRLVKNIGYGRESQSLMIMVTPRIIINEEEEMIFTGQIAPIPRP